MCNISDNPGELRIREAFMKQAKMKPIVEDIGEGGSLQWIDPRQTDRVLLYFHGTFGEASSLHGRFSSRLEVVGSYSAECRLLLLFGTLFRKILNQEGNPQML